MPINGHHINTSFNIKMYNIYFKPNVQIFFAKVQVIVTIKATVQNVLYSSFFTLGEDNYLVFSSFEELPLHHVFPKLIQDFHIW